MGVIAAIPSISTAARTVGEAIGGVVEIFTVNQTKQAAAEHVEQIKALDQFGAEFAQTNRSWFDAIIDGINRLPRPAMALATMGLFAYAMQDPIGFSVRMQGLSLIPEPLWWLMGAVVSFYFGARELHHVRTRNVPTTQDVARVATTVRALENTVAQPAIATEPNPVIAQWQATRD
ncbi:Holin of 3TMs, for gene-transfer release [Monaibacterium marinum]|uniref:Holin of 3TMs, for gene-transfer release n=1 Tax=Pontivivens marinum TaxID=1690039 RepID=A0A2C9CT22_9RHOB|nr:holin family protein [Monaibacterium marinum]SOH93519.1 Holin of 3TMs, for gene-transfer release [Monaibacterium marinum]